MFVDTTGLGVIKIRGYLITYNSSSRKDITKINYFLFGRVAVITRKGQKEKYYYPGFFETTEYKKIANGCYFVQEIYDDLDGLLQIYPITIEFNNDTMITSRDYWQERRNSITHVKAFNLNCI